MNFEWLDYTNPAFYVALSFFIIVGVIIKVGVPGMVAKMLDKRAQEISDEIDAARKLHEEAKDLLASFQRKQLEAEKEAEGIIEQAKAEAKSLKKQAREDLVERLERRTVLAEQRIAQAESQAAADVKNAAAEMAAAAAEHLLKTGLSKTDLTKLVDADIKLVGDRLN